jgi:phytanoyl-CoA hydroxylase
VKSYEREGYAVFQGIYDPKVIQTVKDRMSEIVQEVDLSSDNNIAVFSTENNNRQKREDYFLDSSWQVKPFFEKDALDMATGRLLVDKAVAFNKMGHNMHDLDPVFETLSYSRVIRTLLFKMMKFTQPQIVQSMYIFKVRHHNRI